jgi:transporter family-2 protein
MVSGTARRAATVVLAVAAGGFLALQARVNASLGEQIGDPVVAALVSFGSGCGVLLVVLAVRPATRRGLRRALRSSLPKWMYLGGLGGALFVSAAAFSVPAVGVALFSVAHLAGQTGGALGADRLGIGPGGRRPVTAARLAGAGLAVGAVLLAQSGAGGPTGLRPHALLGIVAAVVGIGVLTAVQAGANGRVSAIAGDPLTATLVNFTVGTVALVAVAAAVAPADPFVAVGGLADEPSRWWLYAGGVLGIGFVAVNVACVRTLGVLRLVLANTTGQLGTALVLDALTPGGPGLPVTVLLGALLTLLAVGITGVGDHRRVNAAPADPAEPARADEPAATEDSPEDPTEDPAGESTGNAAAKTPPDGAGPAPMTARPRRVRVVAFVTAVALVGFFTLIALALGTRTDGGGYFGAGDQAAMVVLGCLLALAALVFARPKVDADAERVRVRNIIGGYDLPWAVVRAVRFDDSAPWASLELADDDTVAVMAVQAADRQHAVDAVRALRALHEHAVGRRR